ncbi:MAG: response regulator transcription factor [Leptospira sp.]|nr:response regulator transcription factor [Leptospira sp.]
MDEKEFFTAAVIDDQIQFRTLIVETLKQDPIFSKVSEFKSGEEFINYPVTPFPDVIFLDIHLPHISGIDLIPIIKKDHPSAKIIMITNMDSEEQIFKCIKNGALGYIYKLDLKNIKEVYSVVLNGGAVFSPTVALRIANQISKKSNVNQESSLTDRERQILNLIIACKRDNEIATFLQISHSTVRFHIKNICIKLEAKNKMELSKIAHSNGWT